MTWKLEAWSYFVAVILADGMLLVRTYAIWDKNRIILISFLLCLPLGITVGAYFLANFLDSFRLGPNPFSATVFPGCFVIGDNTIVWVSYVLLLAYETLIFLVTLLKAAYSGGFSASTLSKAIYRDGLIFYFYIMLASVANIAVFISASGLAIIHITGIHRALHAVLIERLILNIRKAATPTVSIATLSHSNMQFAPQGPERIAMSTLGSSMDASSGMETTTQRSVV